jgi:hypothetical protein
VLKTGAFWAYAAVVEKWSGRKYSFIESTLAGLWLLFFWPVWNWRSSLKPEALWPAFFGVVVCPMVLWYLSERGGWQRWRDGGTIRKFGPLAYLLLVLLSQHWEAGAWKWLASLGPLILWAGVVAMILMILSASWLISNYSRE